MWSVWGVGVLLGWGWALQTTFFSGGGLILALSPLSAWLVRSNLRSLEQGVLRWTGLQWLWLADGSPPSAGASVAVQPMLDVQWAILLRCSGPQSPGGRLPRWLWMARVVHEADDEAWLSLRRAVYSPARREPDAASVSES